MSMLFIIVAIAFTVAMIIMMLRPFSASRQEQLSFELLDEEQRRIEALVSRKVALVQSLQDIEYDWKTDKISEEDYQRFKTSCERQAVGVMRKLDELHGGDRDWEAVIDQAVAERLDDDRDTTASELSSDDGPREDDPSDPGTESSPDAPVCTSCGASLASDDRFCSQCGASTDADPDDALGAGHPDDLDPLSSSSPPEVAG